MCVYIYISYHVLGIPMKHQDLSVHTHFADMFCPFDIMF